MQILSHLYVHLQPAFVFSPNTYLNDTNVLIMCVCIIWNLIIMTVSTGQWMSQGYSTVTPLILTMLQDISHGTKQYQQSLTVHTFYTHMYVHVSNVVRLDYMCGTELLYIFPPRGGHTHKHTHTNFWTKAVNYKKPGMCLPKASACLI